MNTGYTGVVLDTGRQGLTGIWILDTQEQSWILGDKVYQVYRYWIQRSSSGYWETRFNRFMDTGYTSQTQLVLDTKRQGLPGIWILVRHNQVWIQGDKVYQVYGYQLATTSLDTGRQGLPGIWILVRHNQFWIQGDKVYQVYGYQ